MFMRIDTLQTNLPAPKTHDPNAVAALQELLGGKYGEMSTSRSLHVPDFNFEASPSCARSTAWCASITAEELGHVELVSQALTC